MCCSLCEEPVRSVLLGWRQMGVVDDRQDGAEGSPRAAVLSTPSVTQRIVIYAVTADVHQRGRSTAQCREHSRRVQRQGRSPVRPHDDRLGHRRHGRSVRSSPRSSSGRISSFGLALAFLWPPAAAAYECGDLRIRRLGAVRHVVLRRAAHLPRAPVLGDALASFTFWGWQAVIVLAAITLPLGMTSEQGIRRARMAHRHAHRRGVGRVPRSCSSAR